MQWQDNRIVSVSPFHIHSFATLKNNGHTLKNFTEGEYNAALRNFDATSNVMVASRITYKVDGLNITGAVLMPKEARPGKHPILIYNRGGSGNFGIFWFWNATILSQYVKLGYIVFATNYRGNDGGEGHDEFGGTDVHDVLTLLDMARKHPAWDGKNSFMYGHSRGGMMTYLAIKQGAELNAAVAVAGPSDPAQAERQRPDMLDVYRRYIPQFDEHPQASLDERAAVQWGDKLDVPLLLLHGDADDRVDVSHSLTLDATLTRAGKTHKLVIYPGGDHGLRRYRKESMTEILAWFDKYKKLKPSFL